MAEDFLEPTLDLPPAHRLLFVGTTTSEVLSVSPVSRRAPPAWVYEAAEAISTSDLQQARVLDVTVIGTADEKSCNAVIVSATSWRCGPGLKELVLEPWPLAELARRLDAIGTAEAIDHSLALVQIANERSLSAAPERARSEGIV